VIVCVLTKTLFVHPSHPQFTFSTCFLDSGGRLEHPEETHTDMGRTCNLTERSPGSVRTPTTKQPCPIFEPII